MVSDLVNPYISLGSIKVCSFWIRFDFLKIRQDEAKKNLHFGLILEIIFINIIGAI